MKGLPEYYNPMIMGLKASEIELTADAMKAEILQYVKWPLKVAGVEGASIYQAQGKATKGPGTRSWEDFHKQKDQKHSIDTAKISQSHRLPKGQLSNLKVQLKYKIFCKFRICPLTDYRSTKFARRL